MGAESGEKVGRVGPIDRYGMTNDLALLSALSSVLRSTAKDNIPRKNPLSLALMTMVTVYSVFSTKQIAFPDLSLLIAGV